ncbi:MAG: flagellar hook-length control protein FliK [Pseudomonadota bacterium]
MALGPTEGAGARPLTSVDPVRTVAPIGDASDESADRLARLEVGQQFPAKILSRFNDGTFLLRIADTNARVALPGGGNVGDALLLTLLNTSPRPTFSLDSRGDTAAAPAALSSAGRLIAEILGGAKPGDGAAGLVGKLPLLSAPGGSAPQLATALQDTVAFSGLFYESHVGQWADGKRALTDLLREPQAKAGTTTANAGERVAETTIKPGTPVLNPADLSPQVIQTRRNLMEYFSAAPLPAAGSNTLDPGLAQLVGLQLNVLEQQRFQWQGEVWPGQSMTWQVNHDEDGASAEAITPERQHWQSVVSFTLPSLGAVNAVIDLTGDQVRITVRTDNDETAATLRQNGAGLASALDAAGSVLDGLIVRRDPSVEDVGNTAGGNP